MGSFKRILVAVAATSIGLNMLPATGTPTLTGTKTVLGASAMGATGDNQCYTWKRSERGFARKLNNARESQGERRLKLDPEVSKAAKKHAWEMASANVLAHTPSAALKRRVTNWVMLGENVGVGGSVDSLHTAFMNSPGHRSNIMFGGFTNVGVGTVRTGDRMWVTVIFEAVTNPGTTLRMPRC